MNVNALIDAYFDKNDKVSIYMFDAASIHNVYAQIITELTSHFEIETSVLQAFSYCFYEVLDNVLTHSGKEIGTALCSYEFDTNTIKILVADDGIGVYKSLTSNDKYKDYTEQMCITECVKDSVSDGKGMGFGLYSTLLLVENAGVKFELKSGGVRLILKDGDFITENVKRWDGTIVYVEVTGAKEIDPNAIVSFRTDCASEYNDEFIDNDKISDLW